MSDTAELKAGHELDLLVAEKVFGWQRGRRYGNGNGEWIFPVGVEPYFRNDWDGTPEYSTDIKAAWQVVEHFHERDYFAGLIVRPDRNKGFDTEYGCELSHAVGPFFKANGTTMPEAICRAALAAKGEHDGRTTD